MNLPLLKSIGIVGVFWGEFTQRTPEAAGKVHPERFDSLASGGVAVRNAGRHDLKRAPETLAWMASRKVMGKLVVVH